MLKKLLNGSLPLLLLLLLHAKGYETEVKQGNAYKLSKLLANTWKHRVQNT